MAFSTGTDGCRIGRGLVVLEWETCVDRKKDDNDGTPTVVVGPNGAILSIGPLSVVSLDGVRNKKFDRHVAAMQTTSAAVTVLFLKLAPNKTMLDFWKEPMIRTHSIGYGYGDGDGDGGGGGGVVLSSGSCTLPCLLAPFCFWWFGTNRSTTTTTR